MPPGPPRPPGAPTGPPPAAPPGRGPTPASLAAAPGQLHTPPPLLYIDPAKAAKIRQQVTTPPDPAKLPWTPLQKVDAEAAARAVEAAEKRRQASSPTSEASGPVRSAFSSTPSPVTGGGLFGAPRDGGASSGGTSTPRFGAPESRPAAGGGTRTGNQALADAIAKRMQQKGQ